MKNVVTFETARALKEADFPQPDPEFGQLWYINIGIVIWAGPRVVEWPKEFGGGQSDQRIFVIEYKNNELPLGEKIFAPTAADILPLLPQNLRYPIEISGNNITVWVLEKGYWPKPFKGASLVEACASAYLEINKTRQP